MGRHSGEAAERLPLDRRRALILLGGIAATIAAWVLLILQAIDFGSAARDGQTIGWFLLFLATLGAAGCLFLALTLGARLRSVVRGEQATPAPGGGRRAAR